jgi:hypothetical protein
MIDAIGHVAERYKDADGVVGIELFNEPQATDPNLDAFHLAAARRVRQAAPDKLVFFEPVAFRNIIDTGPLATRPMSVRGTVYAPHVYTFAFNDPQNNLATLEKEQLRKSNASAREEAKSWGTPLLVGEWGVGPYTTNFVKYITWQLDFQDEYFASSTFWLWKEQSQGSWGLHDFVPDEKGSEDGTWTERPQMIELLSRPYAHKIAGTPSETTWNAEAGTFTLKFDGEVDAPNELYVPER